MDGIPYQTDITPTKVHLFLKAVGFITIGASLILLLCFIFIFHNLTVYSPFIYVPIIFMTIGAALAISTTIHQMCVSSASEGVPLIH